MAKLGVLDVCHPGEASSSSVLLREVQHGEDVADALFQDVVGELSVGQGAGQLQCPDHQGVGAEGPGACRGRVVGCQPRAWTSPTANSARLPTS